MRFQLPGKDGITNKEGVFVTHETPVLPSSDNFHPLPFHLCFNPTYPNTPSGAIRGFQRFLENPQMLPHLVGNFFFKYLMNRAMNISLWKADLFRGLRSLCVLPPLKHPGLLVKPIYTKHLGCQHGHVTVNYGAVVSGWIFWILHLKAESLVRSTDPVCQNTHLMGNTDRASWNSMWMKWASLSRVFYCS